MKNVTPRLPGRPLRRIAVGVAVCSLLASGATLTALVTQSASNPADPIVQQVEYVDPVAENEPTTTTADRSEAQRAEVAAGRAETAAGRAEVAATKAETAVTATTSPPAATTPPTTVSTVSPVSGPQLAQIGDTTTTSTTTPKPLAWVEVARFQIANDLTANPPPTAAVDLHTGKLRVRVTGTAADRWQGLVWFGDNESDRKVPTQACPATEDNRGTVIDGPKGTTPDCYWRGEWPAGPHVITAGSYDAGAQGGVFYRPSGWVAPYLYGAVGEIIVEEYR